MKGPTAALDLEKIRVFYVIFFQLFSLILTKCAKSDGGEDFKSSASTNPIVSVVSLFCCYCFPLFSILTIFFFYFPISVFVLGS
jgi:hypothetical protein